ncbi:site-specific DNA-methyltransferase [Chitinophaga silvatica]|uniref:Methyltransferase n=1 Tax=Chitinophaga silvatica TaxID=2282649 RepID=A0A3E1Y1X9_9BACT|nr:site-specific DNA-methyltransferase [Chitinophaga silvatica]RFS18671.1 site-specific DNA-methyltransferase [Chitinophaga silvatica]
MSEYQYILGDSYKKLQGIEDGKFKLIITSPPYNVGKEYETKKSIESYLKEQKVIIKELIRVLHSSGSICWQVGNYIDKGEIFPLDFFYYDIFKSLGLKLRNRIIWHFGHGLHSSKRFSGRYETILWFTKEDKYTFNLDDVRVKSKYPGKKHFKGPKKGQYSGNPKGKNPADIWEIVLNDWENEIWNIPNVKSNHVEKTEHPCQYPIELVERCVLALSNADDWVLDPFAGVGSTVLASLKNNRNVIGIEKELKYRDIGLERVQAFQNGTLQFRPIGTPIYDHTQSKLSQVPIEFRV